MLYETQKCSSTNNAIHTPATVCTNNMKRNFLHSKEMPYKKYANAQSYPKFKNSNAMQT